MSVFTEEDNQGLYSPPRLPSLKLTREQKDKLEDFLASSADPPELINALYTSVFDRTFLLPRLVVEQCLRRFSANCSLASLSGESAEITAAIVSL